MAATTYGGQSGLTDEERERLRLQQEAEKEAAQNTAQATENAAQASVDAAQNAVPTAPQTPDPAHTVVQIGEDEETVTPKMIQFEGDVRQSVLDTRFGVVGANYVAAEYKPHMDRQDQAHRYASRMVKHAVGGNAGPDGVPATGNTIQVDRGSFKDARQVTLFSTTMNNPKEQYKLLTDYAEDIGVDPVAFVAEAEKWMRSEYDRELFSVPQTDAGKVRAANKALGTYGLTNAAGQPLDITQATPQQVIQALHMNPDEETRDNAWKAIQILTKTPGSAWYGLEYDKSDLAFQGDALLSKQDYDDWVDEFNGAFTYADAPTEENKQVYDELLSLIEADYGAGSRVFGYMKQALDRSFADRNGGYARGDAAGEQEAGTQTAGTQAEGMQTTPTTDGKKDKTLSTQETVDAIIQEEEEAEKAKAYVGGYVEVGEDGKITYNGVDDKEIGQMSSGKGASGGTAQAPASVITSGGTAIVGGQEVTFSRPIASAGMLPGRSQLFPNENEEFTDPLGMIPKMQAKGEVYGPQYTPPTAQTAAERLIEADKPSVAADEIVPYDPKMTDAQALAAWMDGKTLDSRNEAQIAPYAKNKAMRDVILSIYNGYTDTGNGITGGVMSNRQVYGHTLGAAMESIASGEMDAESTALGAMMLANVVADANSAIENTNGIIIPANENQYDYLLGMRGDLAAQVQQVNDLLGAWNDAETEAARDRAEEENAIREQYMAAVQRNEATPEMLAYLALEDVGGEGSIDDGAWMDDETYMDFLRATGKRSDTWKDDGTFWQGESLTAQGWRRIAQTGGREAGSAFKSEATRATQDLLAAFAQDAYANGMTMKEWLSRGGIETLDQIADIAYKDSVRRGNMLGADAEAQAAMDTISIGAKNSAALGVDAAATKHEESFLETTQLIVDDAVHAGKKWDIQHKFFERYGEQAPQQARRMLYSMLSGTDLSEESKEELKARLASDGDIFDVAAYYLDMEGIQGWLHTATNDKQKALEDISLIASVLPAGEKRIFDAVNGAVSMAAYMADSTLGSIFLGPVGGAAIASYGNMGDTYEKYKGKGATKGEAWFMAASHWGLETMMNYGGNESILDDMMSGDTYITGLTHALKGKKGLESVKTAAKYMTVHGTMRGGQEGFEEVGEAGGGIVLEMLFDVYDKEKEALESGEGLSASRLMDSITSTIAEQDPEKIGQELLSNFGAGAIMGFVFGLGGSVSMTHAAFTDYGVSKKYKSIQMAQGLYNGEIGGTEENIGRFYLQMRDDLQDPAFRKWLDNNRRMSTDLRNIAGAMMAGEGSEMRTDAAATAQAAEDMDQKATAARDAADTGKESYLGLMDQVAAGDTDQIPAMEAALTTWQRAETAWNEASGAAKKLAQQAAEKAKGWIDAVMAKLPEFDAQDLDYTLGRVLDERYKLAQQIYDKAMAEEEAAEAAAAEEARLAEEAAAEEARLAEEAAAEEAEANIAAEEETVSAMTDEEIDAEIARITQNENALPDARAEQTEMGYDEETLDALAEQTGAQSQSDAARREAIIRNQRNQYRNLTDRAEQAAANEDADAEAELLKQRQAVQDRLTALGAQIEDAAQNAPEPDTATAPARPTMQTDPRRQAIQEKAAEVATGKTKEQREAEKAAARVEANVNAMDVETYIEQEHPDATDEQKNAIRKIWDGIVNRTPLQVTKDIYQFASRVQKKFGVKIEFVDSLDGERRGEITGNTIKVARDATTGDVVRQVILHELTHKAEGAGKLYKELQGMILEMKYGGDQDAMNRDIDQKVADYSAYYKAKKRTDTFTKENAKEEITADFMGEILDGNPEMIDRLVADKPTLAQRIVNVIREAIDKFRGVKDPQLEQMKKTVKLFEKALKKANQTDGDAKYSLQTMADGTKYVRVDTDQDIFEGHNVSEYPSIARDYIKKRFRHTVIGEGNNRAFVDARTGGEFTNPANRRMDQETFEGKMRASTELDNLIKASQFVGNSGPQKRHPEFPGGFDLQDVVFEVSGKLFEGRLNIGVDGQGRRRLYDLTKIKSLDSGSWVKQHGGAAAQTSGQSSTDIITENAPNGNSKYSLPSDNALEAEIRAWMQANQAEIDAAEKETDGESQFATKTIQNAAFAPESIKREFMRNPLLKGYKTDTNAEQLDRATARIAENGYEAETARLLAAERFDAEDTVEAGAITAIALENGDMQTALDMALKYRVEGTETGKELQIRKMFSKLSPTNLKMKIAGEMEARLQEHMDSHQPETQEISRAAQEADSTIRDLQGGDELRRINEQGSFTVTDSRWGVPINEKQKALIDHYKLNNVARPGLYYNKATMKQRMLEAILATPDPDAQSGNGLTLTQRLEWMKHGQAVVTQADLDYIADQIRQYSIMPDSEQAGRAGDLALARAYEAYGNITPATKGEKARTWRYVSMLLSLPSAERNVIGNSAMNAVNAATHDTLGVFVDAVTSIFTGKRTKALLTMKERADGWHAFADETVNTFKDYFVDRADTTPGDQGEERFNRNQRGRVFETRVFEDMRMMEGFLMSVGDRNYWKKAYVNSLAEQAHVAEMNGEELDYEAACEIAKAEANYATFNEDNFLRSLLSSARQHPVASFVVDMIMPFTGVPTNITKRMIEYSPIGLATTFIRHADRARRGANFDQKSFVEGLSRALSGSALYAIGFGLGELGLINLGTSDDDDEKVYNLHAAMGEQYSPFIQVGDEYVSLAAFAPSISPIIMGATAHDILRESEDKLQAFANAMMSAMNQIFDASYMSGLADLFDQNGTPAENIFNALTTNAISQTVPAFLTQTATALDPYVRDTKDANAIMQAVKNGIYARLPWAREALLDPKYDISGKPIASKEGLRNFLDPFTTTKVSDDPVLAELDRLYDETGSSSHIPTYLIKTSGKVQILADIADDRRVSMDRGAGEHKLTLTAKERNHYNQMYSALAFEGTGDTRYKGIGKTETRFIGIRETMESRKYQRASDEEKAKMISDVLTKAKKLTQCQIVIDKGYTR